MADEKSDSATSPESDAFLLIREGSAWRHVVRLRCGQTTTVGRSATNRVVLQDDSCSRNHCEVFHTDGQWLLRDLSSRNGTLIEGNPVSGDFKLSSGDIICIGSCRLAFTTKLESTPMISEDDVVAADRETSPHHAAVDSDAAPSILHRTSTPEFIKGRPAAEFQGEAVDILARLFRLGLEMGAARTRQALFEVVLEHLTRETVADIAAILMAPDDLPGTPAPADLPVVAWYSRRDLPYQRVSDNLSRVVVSGREAILATDVSVHRQLAVFDSLGDMKAMSVICSPVCAGERVRGLIHLYCMNPDNPLDRQDLEFTLAAAHQLAVSLDQLTEMDALQHGLTQARNENRSLRQKLAEEQTLIGETESMRDLRDRIALIAETDASVLIRGESGCGKELIARSIHVKSPRSEGPFVCMNCAALNESLLESELFGHEKGAFTGATDRKIGRFEQANEGTLFLDEVGEMSPAIQAKFLRVLEGHPFERIGGRKQIDVNVRVVAATNRDLEEAVEDGDFRKDLYFRLHVAEIIASPLRERRDDIPILAAAFLQKFVTRTGRMIHGFSDEAMQMLRSYDWPGNVRELQNTIERTVILCRNEVVQATDIQLSTLTARLTVPEGARPSSDEYQEQSLADIEQQHILATLGHTEWNKSRAAQILGIERSTLDRKLKRYHVVRKAESN